MKLAVILISVGLTQLVAGGFYGVLAPTRIEQNIQTDLTQAQSVASERLKKELSPEFADKHPKDFEMRLQYEMKELNSLARSAREGWNSLETTSWILAGAGLLTLVAGIATLRSDPVVLRQ